VEQTTNHRGDRKPLLLQTLLDSRRFSRFNKSKIHYVVDEISGDIINRTKAERAKDVNAGWEIENNMRRVPIHYLQKRFANLTNAFVIQNDGDEIINRHVMAHFKVCQDRGTFSIYTPSLVFKRNVAWLLETYDLTSMPIHGLDTSKQQLRNFLWRPGPTIMQFDEAMEKGETSRAKASTSSFGLGAANHFSSPSYLISYVLKIMSTVDSGNWWDSMKQGTRSEDLYDEVFYHNGTKKYTSYFAIERHLFRTRVDGRHKMVHLNRLGSDLQGFVIENLPWSVTVEPHRYPWLYSASLLLARELDYENTTCLSVSNPDPTRCSQL
jgi:hypothetical protein